MVNIDQARQIALSQTDAEEFDHFGRPAYRIKKKRVFATLWPAENRMMVKLTPIDQSVFHSFDPAIFYPVPNKWGLGGATLVELSKVKQDMLEDAIHTAWETANKPTKNIK
ncbi:MAG TPA: MmcQ/YjbR family DNA-binding protein [Mucilaginibacter sp.]|nr:MmcQ/YjbR family DNA-binding protein [Mucilaginibacter sp.]